MRGDNWYDTMLVLHIFTAIVGFGAMFWNGIYALEARKRRGAEGLAIMQTNFLIATKFAQNAIYAVFVTGVLLILMSDDVWEFSDPWLSAAMGLYVLALGLSHGVMKPTGKKMMKLSEGIVAGEVDPASAAPQLQAGGKKMGALGGSLNLLWVVILVLMVFKPGA